MSAVLLILHRGRTTRHELAAGGAIAGRDAACEIVLEDARVSRRHARFWIGSRGVEVEDLGSHNGTWLLDHAETVGRETVSMTSTRRLPPHEPAVLSGSAVIQIGAAVIAFEEATTAEVTVEGDHVVRDLETRRLFALADRVAASELPVLLQGETGAGKEVLAQFIHRRSRRAARSLIAVNCAAVVDSLLEAELFGYEKGAFTGAVKTTPGLLEVADRGTLFLDEIGELSPAFQAKLLRVLEVGELTRVGGHAPIVIDVRYLAATHRDLAAEVAAGRFREDLYYRLAGMTLTVPPLRDRSSEIAPLAHHFAELERPDVRFTIEALERLKAHDWPGNVRELRNVIRRALVLCDRSVIGAEHIQLMPRRPDSVATLTDPEDLRQRAEDLERRRVLDALASCNGNQTRAAKLLGISRRALIVRLERYDLPRPRRGR